VGKNMNRYRTAINPPQTERNLTGEEDVKISDCTVLTETAKDEEQICKEKSASELSEFGKDYYFFKFILSY
jgi:hypothetical protein